MRRKKDSDSENSRTAVFRESLRRTSVDMAILQLLSEQPMYAYQMSAALAEKSEDQAYMGIALYQILYSLEDAQSIRTAQTDIVNHRPRKIYEITPAGKQCLLEMKLEYAEAHQAVCRLMNNFE